MNKQQDFFQTEEIIWRNMRLNSALRERVYSKALHGNEACKRLCSRWEKYCESLPTLEEVFEA